MEATIQEITSQSSVYAQKMDELEDDSASVSSQIAQAEKTYQAQIAAQKKAEEEAARKKAEEEAKKQQQQQNQNNSNSNSNSKPSGGGGTAGSGGYLWPLSGYTRVSSPFGYRNCPFHGQELHGGCDIPAPYGLSLIHISKNKLEHIFYSIAKLAVACKRKETIGKISSGKSAQGRESKRKQGKIMVAAFLCL